MDPETRFQHIKAYQQQLRDDAAAYRLARGDENCFYPSPPMAPIPRTIVALRRLVGFMA